MLTRQDSVLESDKRTEKLFSLLLHKLPNRQMHLDVSGAVTFTLGLDADKPEVVDETRYRQPFKPGS